MRFMSKINFEMSDNKINSNVQQNFTIGMNCPKASSVTIQAVLEVQ